ncbi:hypothetical protein P5G50_04620 [Leifsonia sp. F6_8S_P_1B]|uniref:Alpha-L-rhamnosidase n=1 Tax=Leifsonia williamsii TaxID=3035919 RepID=A0ABT8K8F6_9MICO|nr:alpha-L-rhamnosidase C-terminal domain-containing protein [Leifsonia williamsii]MDN4613730.1 hypothetical protein [Leifsonia williamsii]
MTWYYPPRQYELGMLHELVRSGFAANRHVDYALNHAQPASAAEFRVDGGDPFMVAAVPPAIELPDAARVEVRLPGEDWQPAVAVAAHGEAPPHVQPEPVVAVPLTLRDGLWEADGPLLGRPVFASIAEPVVSSGESREEALADPEAAETRHDVVRLPDGRWTTAHRLGFRYLRVESDNPITDVIVEASRRPTPRAGAFSCSDDELTRIWQVSADTLRVCMQGLMLDGIKRDRMPWIGDQALNTLANAYAFGDGGIVAASLTALGRPRHGFVNGISDYSLWWVIGTGFFASAFDARAYLAGEADHLHAFVEGLAEQAGDDGLLRPRPGDDDFLKLVFIDWGVEADPARDATALQVLWHWALTSAAHLLGSVGHPGAGRWEALAATVRSTLHRTAWDAEGQVWREYADGASAASPYPNFLAVLARLGGADGDVTPAMRALLTGTRRAGTPFMTGFLLRALIEAGEPATAVECVRELWGGMLAAGATSFWEEFAEPGASPYEMYGRPFGKSLCHAWSSSPAALLPDAILGVRPLADGWARFAVAPALGGLEWAEARIPAPQGDIVVRADAGGTVVDVPAGAVLVAEGGEHPGPACVRLPSP